MRNLLTMPYKLAVRSRLWLYEQGWFAQNRLPCSVVSVGNLTVGGTGKTPITMWVAQQLASRGKKVGILSRGYRRASRETFLLVSDGKEILVGPDDAGDEPFLMARRCPGVVVAVGADRYRLGCWVLEQVPLDYVVLDDGFQHVNLHRDVNLLLIDASDPTGLLNLLPVGRLREPLSGASRASAIVLTRVQEGLDSHQLLAPLEAAVGNRISPIATRFRVSHIVSAGTSDIHPPSWLEGRRAFLFSGIGNGSSFRHTVEELGAHVTDELIFPDHVAYTSENLLQIYQRAERSQSDILLTTEKDLVKVEPLWMFPEPILAVSLELQILDGRQKLEEILADVIRNA